MSTRPVQLFDSFYMYPVGKTIPSGYMRVGNVAPTGDGSVCRSMPKGTSRWQQGFRSLVIRGSGGKCYTSGGGNMVLLQKAPVFLFSKLPNTYYINNAGSAVPTGYVKQIVGRRTLRVGLARDRAECTGALPGESTRRAWSKKPYWVVPGSDGRCYSTEVRTFDLLRRVVPSSFHLYGSYHAVNNQSVIRHKIRFFKKGTVGRTDQVRCNGIGRGARRGDIIHGSDGKCYSTDPKKQRDIIIQYGRPTLRRVYWDLGFRNDFRDQDGFNPSRFRFVWKRGRGTIALRPTFRLGYGLRYGSRHGLLNGQLSLSRQTVQTGYALAGAELLYLGSPFALKVNALVGGSVAPTDLHPFPNYRFTNPLVNNGDTLSLEAASRDHVDKYHLAYDIGLKGLVRFGRPDRVALDLYFRGWLRSADASVGMYPSRFGGCAGLQLVRENFPYGISFEACGMDREEIAGGEGGALRFQFNWDIYRNQELRVFTGVSESRTFKPLFSLTSSDYTTDLNDANYGVNAFWLGANWKRNFGKTTRLSLGGRIGSYSIRADLPEDEMIFVSDGTNLGQFRNPYSSIASRGKPFGHFSPFVNLAAKACFNIKGYTFCPTLDLLYNYQNFFGNSHDVSLNLGLQLNLE